MAFWHFFETCVLQALFSRFKSCCAARPVPTGYEPNALTSAMVSRRSASVPPGGYGEARGNGRQRGQLPNGDGGAGNPFWSERVQEEHELRMARPTHLPEMENTPDLLNFDEKLFGDVETTTCKKWWAFKGTSTRWGEGVTTSSQLGSWWRTPTTPGWPSASAGHEVPAGGAWPWWWWWWGARCCKW